MTYHLILLAERALETNSQLMITYSSGCWKASVLQASKAGYDSGDDLAVVLERSSEMTKYEPLHHGVSPIAFQQLRSLGEGLAEGHELYCTLQRWPQAAQWEVLVHRSRSGLAAVSARSPQLSEAVSEAERQLRA